MNAELVERILRCPPLPGLPRVAADVLAMAERPDVSMPALARVVSRDPGLVAKILRTVNAGGGQTTHRIGNVERALEVLGVDGARTLAVGLSLAGDLRKVRSNGGFDHVAFWRRGVYAGAAAEILAGEFRVPLRGEAFVAAVLMDVGMLALDRALGEEYGRVAASAASHEDLSAVERKAFGMTHAEVAAVLAERWALPEVLATPVANHHRAGALESSAVKALTEVVWLAGRCADVCVDARPEWALADVRRALLERYGIGEIACGAILYRIGMRARELAPLFDVAVEDEAGYEAILKRASGGLRNLTREFAASADDAGANKRRAARHARDGVITVYPFDWGRPGRGLPARFHNASSRGIGLTLGREMRAGDQFLLRILQPEGPPASILYTVLRCECVGEAAYRIGAELTCVMRPTAEAGAAAQGGRLGGHDADVARIRRAILASG